MRLIHTLRSRPKAVRVQFAFSVAVLATLLVGAFWSVTVPMRLAAVPVNGTEPTQDADISFREYFNETGSNLGQVIGAFGGDTEETDEGLPTLQNGTGTYTEGAPDDRPDSLNGFRRREAPAVQPAVSRRVLIGTTSSAR